MYVFIKPLLLNVYQRAVKSDHIRCIRKRDLRFNLNLNLFWLVKNKFFT